MHISEQSLQHPDSCRSAVRARWEEGRQVRWTMGPADGLPRALGDEPMGLAKMDAFSRPMGQRNSWTTAGWPDGLSPRRLVCVCSVDRVGPRLPAL